jgi:hypothetical protein
MSYIFCIFEKTKINIMKRIYLIERIDTVDYDQHDSVVIIAKTPKEARQFAYKEYYGDFAEGKITCILIGVANKTQPFGEVLASFNAG